MLGLLLIAAGVVHTQWAMLAVAAMGVASIAWMFVYSYLVWRQDPDKVSPSGTLPV